MEGLEVIRKRRSIREYRVIFAAALTALLAISGCSGGYASEGGNGAAISDENSRKAFIDVIEGDDEDTLSKPEIIYTLDSIPGFSDSPYVEINGNQPGFSEKDRGIDTAFEYYSGLDSLGRCGVAYANIGPEIMPAEERGSIGQVKPSGWHTVKYPDLIADNYLYNRCHLIGYQLAGENANEKNLITGTRYLNVDGMLPFENAVDDYVEETENHVLYRVTPIFEGANLVASGVEMEGWSVEDYGEGICFHVFCYNVQPGIAIDYATGDSWEASGQGIGNAGNEPLTETEAIEGNAGESVENESETGDYVLNTNTKRIHLPDCSSVDNIAENNLETYHGAIKALEDDGYLPCGKCLAEYRD